MDKVKNMYKLKRDRSANFSIYERDILVSLVQKYQDVLENKQSDASTWKKKEAAWESIEKEYNARSGGTFRSTKTLKVKYEGLKRTVRKKSAAIRSELYRTGGGKNTAPPLDDVEEQIKGMIHLSTDGLESIYDSDILPESQDCIAVPTMEEFIEIPLLDRDTAEVVKSEASQNRSYNAKRNMTSTDTYQLKWHSHSAHLNGSVAALLRSERFTDVVLCTMDGSQIPAHKFILSSCSVYLSTLFDGQRTVMRMGGMLYVVLPSEISTKALKILVEYMYKGETTVSNEVLDTVLKAGEVLKIRGLWQQSSNNETSEAEKADSSSTPASVNKQPLVKKPEDMMPKLAMKKDDQNKIIKLNQVSTGPGGVTRPMFIGPPKLVFIKTAEGTTQAALRPGTPMASKGQTILVATNTETSMSAVATSSSHTTMPATMVVDDSPDESPSPRLLRRHAVEKKYGKKQKTEASVEEKEKAVAVVKEEAGKKKGKETNSKPAKEKETMEIQIKDEPEWDNSSIEEEERSIAEMVQAEMNVKSEPGDELDIEEELLYSPLACELCAEMFTVPGAWVRHVEGHAGNTPTARKRKLRSASDDTEETMALLRCDLCQKHFPNPAEWVRHIQSTHTETEGEQSKTCSHCKKLFPSHASLLIHMRTHTGERPFVCGLCNKGFNVKSNLLRHLRTLHDQLISPAQVDDDEEAGPSEVKTEI